MWTAASVALLALVSIANMQNTSSCFGKPKNPKVKSPYCGKSGTLGKPNILFETGGIEQDDCFGRCGNLGFRCKSVAYNTTNGGCSLYRDLLQDMEFTPAPKKNDFRYYNKKLCINMTCGPYCSFSKEREPEVPPKEDIVVDGSFENDPSGWTFRDSAAISDECNGGHMPYDGIRFGQFSHARQSGVQYIQQESTFKANTTYHLSYRYRAVDFQANKIRQYCLLTPILSGEKFAAAPVITSDTGIYSLNDVSVTPTKNKSPQVLAFQLKCSPAVINVVVDLDTVHMVPV